MKQIDYNELLPWLQGQKVPRPNTKDNGTLSGHAVGEPFEKLVYHHLKEIYPHNIFKQYEYLNDLYLKNPQCITIEDKNKLFESPVALFLLNRSNAATKEWNPQNIFEEKQNDTADILYQYGHNFELLDVKTRYLAKNAQVPNIISAYKVAKMCALILDNNEPDHITLSYLEVDWDLHGDQLICLYSHYGNLFKANPNGLYINWAAAMQIQFHVCELDQTYKGTHKEWAKEYLRHFVASAENRCKVMYEQYVAAFRKYIQ